MRVFFFIFIVLCASASVVACECGLDPLSERFRESRAIFVGRMSDFNEVPKSSIQNFREDRFVFKVEKSLKGVSEKYVAIGLDKDEIARGGMCTTFYSFAENADYLIFAYGKDLTVRAICSDSRMVKSESEFRNKFNEKEISRLSSFWFRIRARLWPF